MHFLHPFACIIILALNDSNVMYFLTFAASLWREKVFPVQAFCEISLLLHTRLIPGILEHLYHLFYDSCITLLWRERCISRSESFMTDFLHSCLSFTSPEGDSLCQFCSPDFGPPFVRMSVSLCIPRLRSNEGTFHWTSERESRLSFSVSFPTSLEGMSGDTSRVAMTKEIIFSFSSQSSLWLVWPKASITSWSTKERLFLTAKPSEGYDSNCHWKAFFFEIAIQGRIILRKVNAVKGSLWPDSATFVVEKG